MKFYKNSYNKIGGGKKLINKFGLRYKFLKKHFIRFKDSHIDKIFLKAFFRFYYTKSYINKKSKFYRLKQLKEKAWFKNLFFNQLKNNYKFNKKFLNKKKFFLKIKKIKKNFKIKKNLKIKKRNKICNFILKHTINNFFIIITDLKGKVINYMSAGRVCYSNNKKKKRSYFLVNSMMKVLVKRLRKLNIRIVRIKIKSNITQHMRKVIFFLKNSGFKFQHILFLKPIPHHFGQRKRKLRRV